MSDEFGQRITGVFASGDTILSTDKHPAIFGKSNDVIPVYKYLTIDATSGNLLTTISNTAFGVTTNYEFATQTAFNNTDVGAYVLAVRKNTDAALVGDGEYGPLQTDENGFLKITGTIIVSDSNSTYHPGNVTLVKDTIGVVVTRTTAADEQYTGVMVSGAGYCEWQLEVQAVVFLKWWTTPSHPTEYVDLPDFLKVLSGEVIRIRATNREKAASTASDFTGYATLIRKA